MNVFQHGSFRHKGELYHMSPDNVPQPSQNHYIQRHNNTGNAYLNDAVPLPDANSEPPPDANSEPSPDANSE
jgi:hypothetical protein